MFSQDKRLSEFACFDFLNLRLHGILCCYGKHYAKLPRITDQQLRHFRHYGEFEKSEKRQFRLL